MRETSGGRTLEAVDAGVLWLLGHWLLLANAAMTVYAGLPLAAPLLHAAGWHELASSVFVLYREFCHQMASHSWFVAGYQMAYCQRSTAIYTTMLVVGLLYARRRGRTPGLPFWLYALLALPMLVDGGAATLGVRDSTPLLRTLTGALFGAATVWFVYPLFDRLLPLLAVPPTRLQRAVGPLERSAL